VGCGTGRGGGPSVGDGPEALDGGRQRVHLLIVRALERRREHVCDVRTSPSPKCFPAGDTSCGRPRVCDRRSRLRSNMLKAEPFTVQE
jgi:hypothetical protein